MIYYALKDNTGKYWGGGMKLCYPPILIFREDEPKHARVNRLRSVMENFIKRSHRSSDEMEVVELDSKDYKHLAD